MEKVVGSELATMERDEADVDDRDRATQFVDLLTAHQRDLYAYINTLLVGDSSAPDVLQDTNLDLWSRFEDFDFSRPFLPWAYGFAFQRVLAFRKTKGRSRLVFSDDIVSMISDTYIGDADEADARLSALRSCLEKLEPHQRQLIGERYVGRMSVNSLAESMSSTANQVSARLYRIRRTLARCVENALIIEARS